MTMRWFEENSIIDPPLSGFAEDHIDTFALASVIPDGAHLRRSILQYHLISDPVNIDLLPDNWHPWRVQVYALWTPLEFGDGPYVPFGTGGTAIYAEEVEWQMVSVVSGGENAVMFQSPSAGPTRQSAAQHNIPSRDEVVLTLGVSAATGGDVPVGWPFLAARGWINWRYLIDSPFFL